MALREILGRDKERDSCYFVYDIAFTAGDKIAGSLKFTSNVMVWPRDKLARSRFYQVVAIIAYGWVRTPQPSKLPRAPV